MDAPSCYYRALAVDYDGTLSTTSTPVEEVLEAVRSARGAGLKVVLVTGRVFPDLRAHFPGVEVEFDGIVAENGAVIWTPLSGERTLAAPVGEDVEAMLLGSGVPCHRGRVLLATEARYDQLVFRAISAAGVEYHVVYNRGAMMILPPGVSKGAGLFEALGELGISHHSVIGVGDAENDHSLVEFCELGVAVANAVPSLQSHADIVLGEPNGRGVIELLRGPLLQGDIRVRPKRWQIEVGTGPGGYPVCLPASQTNLLIVGGSGSGKSYLAGLVIERLSAKGYCTCALDPEGDHVTLGNLRGVLAVGGTAGLPAGEQVAELLTHRFGSVVIDMSKLSPAQKRQYAEGYLRALMALRRATGLPHWIVIDEAPQLLGPDSGTDVCGPRSQGICLVTYQPGSLPAGVLPQMDVVLVVHGGERILNQLPGVVPGGPLDETTPLRRGQALLLDGERSLRFQIASRQRPHVRHWHKYLLSRLPLSSQFFFRTAGGPTGAAAANIAEFHHEIERAADEVIRHHLLHGDFSRWLEKTLQDRALAGLVRQIESGMQGNGLEEIMAARERLIIAVEDRYGVPA